MSEASAMYAAANAWAGGNVFDPERDRFLDGWKAEAQGSSHEDKPDGPWAEAAKAAYNSGVIARREWEEGQAVRSIPNGRGLLTIITGLLLR